MTEAERNRRTMTDPGRMLWKDDVEGICRSPDMCFDYGEHVRCGPCAIDQATRAGVTSDLSVPRLPEVSRLRRMLVEHGIDPARALRSPSGER